MDELRISTILDTTGFTAGSKKLKSAISSLGSYANKGMGQIRRSTDSVLRQIVKWGPALVGVSSAYGIISKAVSSFMAQNKQLSANLSSAWTAIGNVLGPVITQIVNLITTAVSYFIKLLQLFGFTNKSASEASKAINNTSGAAQNLKKQLMGFDELNVLQDNNSGSGNPQGSLKDLELPDWLKEFAELLKNKEFEEAGKRLAKAVDDWADYIDENDLSRKFGNKVGTALNNALKVIYNFFNDMNSYKIGKIVADFFNGALESIDFKLLANTLSIILIRTFEFFSGILESIEWANYAQYVKDFFTNLDIDGIAEAAGSVLYDIAEGAFVFFWSLIRGKNTEEDNPMLPALDRLSANVERAYKKIKTTLVNLKADILDPLAEWLASSAVPTALTAIGDGINTVASAVQDAGSSVGDFWKNNIQPWLGEHTSDIKTLSDYISSIVSSILSLLTSNGTLTIMWATFTLIYNVFSQVIALFDVFATEFSTEDSPISVALNELSTSVGESYESLLETFTNLNEKVFTPFATWLTQSGIPSALTGISGGITTITNAVSKAGSSIADFWEANIQPWLEAHSEDISKYTQKIADIVASIIELLTSEESLNLIWSIVQGIYEAFTSAVDAFDNLAKLLTGDESLGEFIENLDLAQAAILLFVGAMGLKGLIDMLVSLKTQFLKSIDVIGSWKRLIGGVGNSAGAGAGGKTGGALFSGIASAAEEATLQLAIIGENLGMVGGSIAGTAATVAGCGAVIVGAVAGTTYAIVKDIEAWKEYKEEVSNMSADEVVAELARTEAEVERTKKVLDELANQGYYSEIAQAEYDQSRAEYNVALARYNELLGQENVLLEDNADAITESSNAVENVSDSNEQVANTMANLQASTRDAVEKIQEMKGASEEAASGQTVLTDATGKTGDEVVKDTETMEALSRENLEQLKADFADFSENTRTVTAELSESLTTTTDETLRKLETEIARSATTIYKNLGTVFRGLAIEAYTWGADICVQMSNGIASYASMVISMVYSLASGIRRLLHFSEPDEGPLSDFHTYMPDMVKEMARGIEDNEHVALDAVGNLAEGIAEEIQGQDYSFGDIGAATDSAMDTMGNKIIEGFLLLIDRLQEIAETVAFKMPEFATGMVTPYGVNAQPQNMSTEPQNYAEIVSAIQRLEQVIIGQNSDGEMSVKLYLDGKQISDTVTKYQRQSTRARGA